MAGGIVAGGRAALGHAGGEAGEGLRFVIRQRGSRLRRCRKVFSARLLDLRRGNHFVAGEIMADLRAGMERVVGGSDGAGGVRK